MSEQIPARPRAWIPLTPRGVAAFAHAGFGRLLAVQVAMAVLATVVVVWFFREEWFPVVRAAIQQLPAQGEIRGGQLNWSGDAPVKLGGNRFIEFTVDPGHVGQIVREAQLRLEFGRHNLRVLTFAGGTEFPYPPDWRFAVNRTELEPWWGAWAQVILAGIAAATFVGLLVSWTVLATVYCLPVKLVSLFENRDLRWGQGWRLAGAAMMPGALFLVLGIGFYGLTGMALIQLALVWCLHLVFGWIYLVVSPMFLPRDPEAAVAVKNPFGSKRVKKP
jgi:hypothetical protein